MTQHILLEVCANSVTSALAAQNGGAERVELCENLHIGGTTPTYGDILMAREQLHIKLYVLIRPRSGDFLYSDLEFKIIIEDIKHCLEAGCDGIVVGILKPDGSIDKERCAQIVKIVKDAGAGITFHRAFDRCNDQFKALEDIIELGFERILTSGGKNTAMEGSSRIARLIEQAKGRIIIMPGSGINEKNVMDLVHFTGAIEIHSSARVLVESKMNYKNDAILMNDVFNDDYSSELTDEGRVKEILKNANERNG
jgi:copper homeostasis protein